MMTTAPSERFIGVFDDRHTLRFELSYPHSPEVVWRAITEPEQLAEWFLFIVIEPRIGGAVVRHQSNGTLNERTQGTVTALDPPRLLEYEFTATHEWPDSVLRFELAAEGDGTHMTFTQRLARHVVWTHETDAGSNTLPPGAAAGWQDFFVDQLGALLDGRPRPTADEVERLDILRANDARKALVAQFD